MITPENYQQLFAFVESTPSLAFILISLAILSISVSMSAFDNVWVRFAFIVALAGATGWLAADPDPMWSTYFTNISAELIGALIAAALLGSVMLSPRWLFPIVMLAISVAYLPMDAFGEDTKYFFMEINSELIGAFVLYVLLEKRHVLWSSAKKAREKRHKQLRRNKQRLRDAYRAAYVEEINAYDRQQKAWLAKNLEAKKSNIAQGIQQHMNEWRKQAAQWDVAVIITGSSRQDVRRKYQRLRRAFGDFKVMRVTDDQAAATTECCVVGRLEAAQPTVTHSPQNAAAD